jgi:hypothetical protein
MKKKRPKTYPQTFHHKISNPFPRTFEKSTIKTKTAQRYHLFAISTPKI